MVLSNLSLSISYTHRSYLLNQMVLKRALTQNKVSTPAPHPRTGNTTKELKRQINPTGCGPGQ